MLTYPEFKKLVASKIQERLSTFQGADYVSDVLTNSEYLINFWVNIDELNSEDDQSKKRWSDCVASFSERGISDGYLVDNESFAVKGNFKELKVLLTKLNDDRLSNEDAISLLEIKPVSFSLYDWDGEVHINGLCEYISLVTLYALYKSKI